MMEPASAAEDENVPEKLLDVKEGGPSFNCSLYDTATVHKIAQAFIPGLATACVDNTTGDIFRSPGSVAAVIRKEMIEYLTQRSESFVAEYILESGREAEASSDHPFDIISDFIDDFATSKRNLFSRVSGWLLSERREDNIDDFAQELEINGFWLMDPREEIAQSLLKNVDFKNEFHCTMMFKSEEELTVHVENCGYRSMNCENEGCSATFSASQTEKHESSCPFKIIQCEQNCSEKIMRREMDRHCITVCPMKLVNCPFYSVGCQSAVPQRELGQHRSENLHAHLMYILRNMYKEADVDDLKNRIDQLLQLSTRLGEARDARSLNYLVKDLDAKLGPLEIKPKENVDGKEVSSANSTPDSLDQAESKVTETTAQGVKLTNEAADKDSQTADSTGGATDAENKTVEVGFADKGVEQERTETIAQEVKLTNEAADKDLLTVDSTGGATDAENKVVEVEFADKGLEKERAEPIAQEVKLTNEAADKEPQMVHSIGDATDAESKAVEVEFADKGVEKERAEAIAQEVKFTNEAADKEPQTVDSTGGTTNAAEREGMEDGIKDKVDVEEGEAESKLLEIEAAEAKNQSSINL